MKQRRWQMVDDGRMVPQRWARVRFSAAARPRSPLVTATARLWVLIGLAIGVHAQEFALDWFTIDGGGGTSSGGGYSVSGTIGQPDAGVMSAGTFTLQGGFWPGILVPSTGEVPSLHIQLAGDSVIVSWSPATPGFTLEAAADLTGAIWTTAPTGNPVTIQITGPARFYRLRRP